MGIYPPLIFRNPQFLFLLVLLPALALLWRWRGRRVHAVALGLRLLSVALVILALADPIRARTEVVPGQIVLLVDQSDSLGDAGKAALRDHAAALARAQPERVKMLYFGASTAAPEEAPVRADNSDIAGALRAARELVGGSGGRIVLLSDGAQTRGDALATAQALGVPVDTLGYQAPARPEIWVAAIGIPQTLREGEEYTIEIVAGSSEAATARLTLDDGAAQLAAQDVQLTPGENRLTFRARAGQPGILRLSASLDGRPDTFAQNNHGAATALVAPQPRVLLVESQPGTAAPLRTALRPAGVTAETIPATALPTRLSDLEAFEGIVLLDVPAGDLTLDQMTALREFVRSEGRGLVATGGRSSFTLGAYKGTPLEEVLPVTMDPPPRPVRSDVTLLLIIDHSYSMAAVSGVSKLDMAKEAAILATESLHEDDRVGVLTFDDKQQWAVDFQTLGAGLSLGAIQDRISAIPIGGGTDIRGALQAGLPELAAQPGKVRHAVLLTDGRSFDGARAPYRELIEQARAQNITLSAIAIGGDSDTELLQNLAQWGAGRYHFAATPDDIPRLTLLESEIARTEPLVEGDFRADIQTPHPLLRDFAPNEIPRLGGYVATTIKPAAELVLRSPERDPVLAVWQYGLGRAVAWTPSVEAPWAESWPNWPEYGKFWAQIIRYTLPEPDSGPLQIRVTPRGDAVTISADSLVPSGEPLDLADTEATITLPDGTAQRIPLRQTAPGHYAEEVALPSDGPYAIEVRQRKDDQQRQASAGYVQRPSDEYLPAQGGAELLSRISTATGGRSLSKLDELGKANVEQRGETGLWVWLLVAAALLWPVEIAVRRLGWRLH
ncbi:MAG: VWA domain-containing protein [Roseiflexaceae bacterium]